MSFAKELVIAQLAVQRATILTKRVFHEKAKGATSKADKSPVTIGDFGAQALIISALKHNFPADEIVAEEDADDLRAAETLTEAVWDHVRATRLSDPSSEAELGGAIEDVDATLDAIDLGKSRGGNAGRVWTVDPIDGTRGFLRGGQYAVCLGLVVRGRVKVGVLGCPNLPIDDSAPPRARRWCESPDGRRKREGGPLLGRRGRGGPRAAPSPTTAISPGGGRPIAANPLAEASRATFVESVEAGHCSRGDHAEVVRKLGASRTGGGVIRMDSQAKYGSVARGAGDVYLRLPVGKVPYREKIWDHAAGDLLVREAGGLVTDVHGKGLDFGAGRTLANNRGVVAAPKDVHGQILAAVQEVLGVVKS